MLSPCPDAGHHVPLISNAALMSAHPRGPGGGFKSFSVEDILRAPVSLYSATTCPTVSQVPTSMAHPYGLLSLPHLGARFPGHSSPHFAGPSAAFRNPLLHRTSANCQVHPLLGLTSPDGVTYSWVSPPKAMPRKRTVFSRSQRALLEAKFQAQKYISKPDRIKFARELSLKDSQVKVWFINRRTKWRNDREKRLSKAKSAEKAHEDRKGSTSSTSKGANQSTSSLSTNAT